MLFQNKENKTLFGPPPPPKKRLKDTNDRDMSTRISVCLYQRNPFIENYHLIIVVFSGTYSLHFIIYGYFLYIRKHTKFQRQGHSLLRLESSIPAVQHDRTGSSSVGLVHFPGNRFTNNNSNSEPIFISRIKEKFNEKFFFQILGILSCKKIFVSY